MCYIVQYILFWYSDTLGMDGWNRWLYILVKAVISHLNQFKSLGESSLFEIFSFLGSYQHLVIAITIIIIIIIIIYYRHDYPNHQHHHHHH